MIQPTAGIAFSKQSSSFDQIEEESLLLQYMRKRIHEHCLRHFPKQAEILELNSGTGIDAVFFAKLGMKVQATDIAEGMISELRSKITAMHLNETIHALRCSYTQLPTFDRSFDVVFSDFGGLNCIQDLRPVVDGINKNLKKGGLVTLVIMPKICFWEMALALKGNFKVAFRRFKKNGAKSHLEGQYFMTYYFSYSYIRRVFGTDYELVDLEGLCSFVPPPYFEKFPNKYRRIFQFLSYLERHLKSVFPFNKCADHLIITLRRK